VLVAAVVALVVEVRVMLPLTEPGVAADVAAVVLTAVVAPEVVAAVVVDPVVLAVPLDEPSLAPPQPASANDRANAQGSISRFAARPAGASVYDDSSCSCVA
jgi:hypothetical protein